MDLTWFRTLGRSGLIVRPLALGAMTSGNTNAGGNGSKNIHRALRDVLKPGGEVLQTLGSGCLDLNLSSFQNFNDRNRQVLDRLRAIAAEIGQPLAQIALAWVCAQPGNAVQGGH